MPRYQDEYHEGQAPQDAQWGAGDIPAAPLTDRIQAALEARKRDQEQAARNQQSERARRVQNFSQEAFDSLKELLDGEELIAQFGMVFGVFQLETNADNGDYGAKFVDAATEYRWRLESRFGGFTSAGRWYLYRDEETTKVMRVQNSSKGIVIESADDLLVAIGESRIQRQQEIAKLEAERIAEEEKAAAREKQAQERAEMRLRDELAREELMRKTEAEHQAKVAEHERALAMVNANVAQQIANLWQWTPGKVLTLYRVQWCKGVNPSCGEEEGGFDYDTGWSLLVGLRKDGFVLLMPERYSNKERNIHLSLPHHLPTFERMTFDSVESLPFELKNEVRIHVTGVSYEGGFYDRLLIENPEGSIAAEEVNLPRQWIMDMVDAL